MANQPAYDFCKRPRRLRRTPALRELVRETQVTTNDLILPLFVIDGDGGSQAISSMPGQRRLTIRELVRVAEEAALLGVKAVALFPALESSIKTPTGMEALNKNTLILRAVRALKTAVPELCVITDIALDPYTTHGHDGVLTADETDVDNDATVAMLTRMAVINAEAGVDMVAPSDMMDGRIGAIRAALDGAGYINTTILAYSAKYASAFYGPFRDAVGSAKAAGTRLLGKHTYQLNPANRREAFVETDLDEAEGADILMVKPAGPYLDIIRELRDRTALPVAAYQVSGEYAQLHAAAQLGWLDLEKTRDESLLAIKRAGADMILTYFALDVARALAGRSTGKLEELPHHDAGSGV
ncbi:MAG: porphobilinogen synthase [Verrucomicrobiota bacterium]|nr:porphobilinogen synthase [Verrucomicrobiota bacterium]